MSQVRYQSLGPLMPGEGSRPFLALALQEGAAPRPVVLVWAPPEVAEDAMQRARLERETERAVVFEHPNILRVYGLVTLEGRLARVTEYADGEPLRQVLDAGQRLPTAFAALIAADVAMGVHYAHVAGNDDGTPLIHGDLRPETVMVSFSGVCKVSGYGALGVAPRERSGRRVRSRRLYIAPEQLMGGREASSVLTDVFLLGLLLYECLSGRKPFQDSIEPDKAILNRPLPPLPAEVPLAYNEVVRRATAKRAGDRYPSALAFREALVAAAGELPSSAAFAELIAKLLPPDSETRAARKRTIDKGLEELARNVPVGPSPLTAGSAAPVAPSIPSETPPVRDEDPDDSEAPDRPAAAPARRSSAPLAAAIGALLLVSAVGTVWSIRQESAPTVPGAVAMATGEEPRFDTPVLLEAAPKAPADTGGRVASNAGTAAPPAPAVPPTPVEILVNPDVAVSVDGRAVGRSPLTVPLAPGRHMLTFLDEARGLRTARMIDVRSTPDTVTFRIRLGMGSILVHAPAGARVTLDGQELGTAPVPEKTLFEGEHHLRVTRDEALWENTFTLPGDQRLVFNVDFEE